MPFQPPMFGSLRASVHAVRPFSIHGDEYFELTISTDTGDALLRVPAHALTTPPAAGQNVTITFLMGQVTGVKPE